MSSEGKKKRGEAGSSNAKNIAFRYGGSKCDYSTKIGHTTHPRLGGSKFLAAMAIGSILPGFNPSERAIRAADECMDECPKSADIGVIHEVPDEHQREIYVALSKNIGPKKRKNSDVCIRISSTLHEMIVGNEVFDLSEGYSEYMSVEDGRRVFKMKQNKIGQQVSGLLVSSMKMTNRI